MAPKKEPPAPRPRRQRALTEAERTLWQQITQQVTPLRPVPTPKPVEPTPAPVKEPEAAIASLGGPMLSPLKPAEAAPAKRKGPPPIKVGKLDNIDRATARRFAKGEREIDGVLDLHGMTQAAAHGQLIDFLLGAWAQGWRCVLVITGKGQEKPDHRPWPEPESRGILRRALPQWVNEPPLRGKILGITSAKPQHGGTGAFYLLIRRDRDETKRGPRP